MSVKYQKRTKIVATIGPASSSEDTLRAMIRAGLNVARINFSHGTHQQHGEVIQRIRRISAEENTVVGILADLQGPKIRLGKLDPDPIEIKPGDQIVFTSRPNPDQSKRHLPLPHPEFIRDIRPGNRLLLDDGELEMIVRSSTADSLTAEVVIGGALKSRKGVSSPDASLKSMSALTQKDREDAIFALEQGVDFLAMSFVRTADDMRELRWLLRHHGGDVWLIAKIEKYEAIDNFEEILSQSDGIMVARGDLGLEIPASEVPIQQKRIIQLCNRVGKPVITATQMLNSMIESPRPTRAEASDVANAIFDGTDAVMLSGETASGKYPVEAVATMAEIARISEQHLINYGTFMRSDFPQFNEKDDPDNIIANAISIATTNIADSVGAKMIVTSTWTGYTARRVARERPNTPILCVTPNSSTFNRMSLIWGVLPMLIEEFHTIDEMLQLIVEAAQNADLVETNDIMVIIAGVPFGAGGQTNFMKIHRVGEDASFT
ncbi:MAG: pyruvate kinase [Phototrophicales bacterium]|nr:MAG: pyruvate kinase [Phototrophicales bacterium]